MGGVDMREIDSWSGRSWAIIGTTRGAERAQVGVEMVRLIMVLSELLKMVLLILAVEVVLLVRTMIRKERRVLVVALDVIGELVHAEAPVRYRDLERLHLL